MKVLRDNYSANHEKLEYNNSYPRKLKCENCTSELEYEKSDLRMGAWGCMYLDCPLCGYENMLEDNEDSITLTVDNTDFPTHYYHVSTETGAVDVSNNEIKMRLHEAVNYFRKNKEEFAWFTHFGNLSMHVYRLDGDENYEVFVSKDYYNTSVPFESKDYK